MTVYRETENGWEPDEPLGYQPGLDVEVYGDGQWQLYDGPSLIASGQHRNQFVRAVAIRRAIWRHRRHNWAPLLWLAAFVVIVGVLLAVTR